MLKYVAFTILLVSASVYALPETCRDFAAQANFDWDQFLGKYYVSWYAVPIDVPGDLSCLQLEFEATESNGTYRLLLSRGGSGVPLNINVLDPQDPARWVIKSALLPNPVPMILLSTDYNNGIYITCGEQDGSAVVGEISVFSRDGNLSEEVFTAYNDLLGSYGVLEPNWLAINQTGCL